MELSASGAKALASKLEIPLGAIGFIMGTTAKDAAAGGSTYRSNVNKQISDFIGHLGVGGVSVGAYTSTANFKFSPTGFLNRGFWAALGLWLANELGGSGFGIASKVIKVVDEWGSPIAIGYSLGGFIDPPPLDANQFTNQTYGAGSATQATAAAAYNNMLNMGGQL